MYLGKICAELRLLEMERFTVPEPILPNGPHLYAMGFKAVQLLVVPILEMFCQ